MADKLPSCPDWGNEALNRAMGLWALGPEILRQLIYLSNPQLSAGYAKSSELVKRLRALGIKEE